MNYTMQERLDVGRAIYNQELITHQRKQPHRNLQKKRVTTTSHHSYKVFNN